MNKKLNKYWLVVAAAVAFVGTTACGRTTGDVLEGGVKTQYRIVDATADVGLYSSARMNPQNGLPSISYYDLSNGDLKYASLRPNGEWVLETVDDTGDVGTHTVLRFSSIGEPHIAYYDETNLRPKYAYFNGAEWVKTTIDYPREGGKFIGMDLDLNDTARLSFIAGANFNLEYALYVPTSGINETQVFTLDNGTQTNGRGGNVNQKTNLHLREVQSDQFPVITYYQASLGLLQIAFFDPTHPSRFLGGPQADWVFRVIDGSEATDIDVGLWSSSYLEDNNKLHIAYYDANREDLKYAWTDLSTDELIVETVDTEGVVGQGSSMIVDANGIPTIAYYDATNNDLKLATRSFDNKWKKFRVDLKGLVGSYPSIVAFDNEQVGIAYRDKGHRALKFGIFQTYTKGSNPSGDAESSPLDGTSTTGDTQ